MSNNSNNSESKKSIVIEDMQEESVLSKEKENNDNSKKKEQEIAELQKGLMDDIKKTFLKTAKKILHILNKNPNNIDEANSINHELTSMITMGNKSVQDLLKMNDNELFTMIKKDMPSIATDRDRIPNTNAFLSQLYCIVSNLNEYDTYFSKDDDNDNEKFLINYLDICSNDFSNVSPNFFKLLYYALDFKEDEIKKHIKNGFNYYRNKGYSLCDEERVDMYLSSLELISNYEKKNGKFPKKK